MRPSSFESGFGTSGAIRSAGAGSSAMVGQGCPVEAFDLDQPYHEIQPSDEITQDLNVKISPIAVTKLRITRWPDGKPDGNGVWFLGEFYSGGYEAYCYERTRRGDRRWEIGYAEMACLSFNGQLITHQLWTWDGVWSSPQTVTYDTVPIVRQGGPRVDPFEVREEKQ